MSELKNNTDDNITEFVRQSIVQNKGNKDCIRDFSGDVFELTSDMRIKDYYFDQDNKPEINGIAESILHKYARLLCISK